MVIAHLRDTKSATLMPRHALRASTHTESALGRFGVAFRHARAPARRRDSVRGDAARGPSRWWRTGSAVRSRRAPIACGVLAWVGPNVPSVPEPSDLAAL